MTYVPNPSGADGAATTADVILTGTGVVGFPSAQPVFVTGGTIGTTVSFSGTVNADIGSIEIKDQNGNMAVMPSASTAKTGSTIALVVQHVDDTGTPLREQTQITILNTQGTLATSALQITGNTTRTAILNSQGTLATSALQTTGNSIQAAILNSQGTLATNATQTVVMNNQGTQSTSALQTAGNSSLTVILNNQGTLATSNLQTAGNAIAVVVMNDMGTLATAALQTAGNAAQIAVMNNQGTLATNALQTAGNTTRTAILNNQGTLATAVNQATSISQFANVTRTYGSTGTFPASNLAVQVRLDSRAASTDAFGRLRVSSPDYRFDGQNVYQVNTDQWDVAWNSTGTVTFDSTNRMVDVTCAANGTSVFQSHYYAPYTPGRSQLAFLTFVLGSTPSFATARRVGYYDGKNGVYLEQADTGISLVVASTTSNGNETVAQSNWNIDKMDGTGPSGITLDLTKVQILAISLQALYSGRVFVGFDIDGIIWPVHQFVHANRVTVPYVANASLPIRYEARSTGSNTTNLNAICASVISEGGGPITSIPCRTFGTNSPIAGVSVNARRPILSIRARQQLNAINNTGIILPTALSSIVAAAANNQVLVELVRNGTLGGASWNVVDSVNSIAEMDTSATTITGGSTVFTGLANAGANGVLSISPNIIGRLVIAYSQLLNTPDTLSVVITGLSGTNEVFATLNWNEIR